MQRRMGIGQLLPLIRGDFGMHVSHGRILQPDKSGGTLKRLDDHVEKVRGFWY